MINENSSNFPQSNKEIRKIESNGSTIRAIKSIKLRIRDPIFRELFLVTALVSVFVIVLMGFLYNRNTTQNSTFSDEQKADDQAQVTTTRSKVQTNSDKMTDKKIIENLSISSEVPTIIEIENEKLYLYEYEEIKKRMYCVDVLEDCDIEPVYGDYTAEGYDCFENPFYNSKLPPPPWDTLPIHDERAVTINFGGFEFLTDESQLSVFLLKDQNNKCHPYKHEFTIFDEEDSTSPEYASTDFYKIKSENKLLANKYYSPWGYWCGGSKFRILASSEIVLPLLVEVEQFSSKIVLYRFAQGVEVEDIKDIDIKHVLCSDDDCFGNFRDTSNNSLIEEFNKIKENTGILFLKSTLSDKYLFVFPEVNYMFVPGC